MKKIQRVNRYGHTMELYDPETLEEAMAMLSSGDGFDRNGYRTAFEWLKEHAIDDERVFRAFVVYQLKSLSLDVWRLRTGKPL